jgi:hypothetical protein
MRGLIRPSLLVICPLLGVGLATACGSKPSGDTAQAPNNDAGGIGATPEGHINDEAGPPSDAAAVAPSSNFRVAHLSADLPALDVCVAPHGTTSWQGPLIGRLSGIEAGAPGIAYAQVSAYLPIGAGQNDILLVPAGSSSCAAPGLPNVPVVSNLPPSTANSFVTILIAGEVRPTGGDKALTFATIPDDSQLAGGAASLRAVNAMPCGDALDFGLGSATRWTPLFTGVPFGTFGTQAGPSNGTTDGNGYLPVPALSAETLSVRWSSDAGPQAAASNTITVPVGAIATVVAVGRSGDPPALLLCVDNQPSGGILSDCSLAP